MVGVSVILNRTVVDSDWRFKTCAVVIFRVKVNCITSVDSGLAGITVVLDNTRPAMSKTSLDFGLFCDVNQNLKARRFLADYLGNGILLHRVQNVMVCDLWLVDFDLFSVFSVFVRVSVFSRFCSQVFLPSYWKMTIETLNTEEAQIWEGENEPVRSRQHLIFQVCSLLPPLFDKD